MDQSLDRKKDGIEKGLPSFENAFKVRTDWFDEKRYHHNKEPSLNSGCAHVTFCESNTDATGEKAASVSAAVRQPRKDRAAIALCAFAVSTLSSRKS